MAYCGPARLAHSDFLAWSQDDQDKALMWQAHEARRCSSCGHHSEEGIRHVHVDVCPGCVAVQRTSAGEDSKVRGARLRMISGSPGGCARCKTDASLS